MDVYVSQSEIHILKKAGSESLNTCTCVSGIDLRWKVGAFEIFLEVYQLTLPSPTFKIKVTELWFVAFVCNVNILLSHLKYFLQGMVLFILLQHVVDVNSNHVILTSATSIRRLQISLVSDREVCLMALFQPIRGPVSPTPERCRFDCRNDRFARYSDRCRPYSGTIITVYSRDYVSQSLTLPVMFKRK